MRLATLLWALALPITVLSSAIGAGLTADQLVHLYDDPKVTHVVHFDIAQASSDGSTVPWGTLDIALFGETVPITTKHFIERAASATNGYTNAIFHRVVKDFVVQGGDLVRHKDGYTPIEFERFDDENFELLHNKLGRLSMANAGPNTNGPQFFITTKKEFPHLNGKHVVFGQLVSGFDVLDKMNMAPVKDGRPTSDIIITKSTVSEVFPETGDAVEQSASSSYFLLMFFCFGAALVYGAHRYNRRRSLVDLASFKM